MYLRLDIVTFYELKLFVFQNKSMFQCATSVPYSAENKKALYWVICVGFLFFLSQIVGGIWSHSLAVLLDASHIFSDLLGFCLSLYILHLKQKPPTETFTYGFQRADVVGGLASIMLIWLVTGMLLLEAVYRLITPQVVSGSIMFIMGCAGVVQAAMIAYILKDHAHAHSHGGHGHSHAHVDLESDRLLYDPTVSYQTYEPVHENLNMHSAFLHAMSDMIQSFGVLLAGVLIWAFPKWTRIDPLCTFLFAFLVLRQTIPTLKEIILILMQASPPVDYEGLQTTLLALSFVKKVEHVHVWRNGNQTIGTAHLNIAQGSLSSQQLAEVQRVFSQYGIDHPTIQCVH